MSNTRKDGCYSWFYLTATVMTSFTFIGLVDSVGIIVAVFIDHFNESNAKGGMYRPEYVVEECDRS